MNAMRHLTKLLVLTAVSVAAASCGDMARTGRSPVYLVLDSLTASQGGSSGSSSNVLLSDVASDAGGAINDVGQATFHIELKNINSTTGPTSNNQVTINRYHVLYRRADGHNTEGVDVPFAFDGAVTVTVPTSQQASVGFELVRHNAKHESPLVQLVNNPLVKITTIADVTFYGQDLVGNDIQVTGSIQVDFGNFADR